MKKGAVALFIFCCALVECCAQSSVDFLSKKFNTYQSTRPKTKLHLVFNQNKYSPGDTAYFKAYFLKEDLTPIQDRQLIDINLVDSQGKSRLHFIFPVNNGIGQNQLSIPDTLSAGIYVITAHSNWMKNFDPAFIFKKEISIVKEKELIAYEKPSLKAMAEGGHLINDLSNKVSIRSYRAGSTVQIIDATGKEFGQATADTNGIASITFIPKRNSSYFVKVVGETTQTSLPQTEEDGCSLFVDSSEKGEPIKVRLTSPPGSTLRNEELIFIVSGGAKIYHSTSVFQGNRDFVEVEIPKNVLPAGIVHISVLTHAGSLLANRDFYCVDENPVEAKILSAQDVFQTREKVKVEILLTDRSGKPVEGEFSISVLNSGLFGAQKQPSLADELTILSDVRERISIDRSDPNWFSSLDNFLILATESLPWKEIMSKEIMKPRFPFTGMIERNGRVYFSDTMQPVPDNTQVMFYLQRSKTHYQTFTSNQGRLSLVMPDFFGEDEFFYLAQTKGEEIKNITIQWEDEQIPMPHSVKTKELESLDDYATFSSKKRIIDQSFGIHSAVGITDNNLIIEGSDIENKIAKADFSIHVKDYLLFPTMQELIKEIIPSMYYRKAGGKDIVRVSLRSPMLANSDPVYIIDGVATKNTALFLSLQPSELLTFKVIYEPRKLMPLGLLGKNGIVMIQTSKDDVREPLDVSKLINGFNQTLSFKALDYSGERDSHKPDFRSTVYWNPTIRTDSKGKAIVEFYSSDDIGKLTIHMEGLATGGRPFTAEKDIKVIIGSENK